MATLLESLAVDASLAEVWDFYFDARGWSSWVDGLQAVESAEGYPEAGGTLVWRSTPAGRGTVTEQVTEHQPRRRHQIEFADPGSSGTLLSRFEVAGPGTRVTLELDYRLARVGILSTITERLFVRGQVRQSLQRSLLRLKHEVEEIAHFADQGTPSSSTDR